MYFPPSVNRASAVETLGEELGLRIRDSAQGNEPLVVNCLNEAVVEKALTLDGLVFNNPGGHPGGKISVQRVKSLPLGAKELMAMVDALVWGEYEVQRMSQPPQGEQPKPTHTPWQTPNAGFQGRSFVRAVANNSPNRGRQSPPRNFPSGGKVRKGSKGGDSHAPVPRQIWCYTCGREGRSNDHPFFECVHWQNAQAQFSGRKGGKGGSTPPRQGGSRFCLNCQKKPDALQSFIPGLSIPTWARDTQTSTAQRRITQPNPPTPTSTLTRKDSRAQKFCAVP